MDTTKVRSTTQVQYHHHSVLDLDLNQDDLGYKGTLCLVTGRSPKLQSTQNGCHTHNDLHDHVIMDLNHDHIDHNHDHHGVKIGINDGKGAMLELPQ